MFEIVNDKIQPVSPKFETEKEAQLWLFKKKFGHLKPGDVMADMLNDTDVFTECEKKLAIKYCESVLWDVNWLVKGKATKSYSGNALSSWLNNPLSIVGSNTKFSAKLEKFFTCYFKELGLHDGSDGIGIYFVVSGGTGAHISVNVTFSE